VFHGSPEATLTLRSGVLYGVRDFGFAASYATDRAGQTTGYVHTLDFHFRKLATKNDVDDLAEDYGLDINHLAAVTIVDQNHDAFNADILDGLREHGYDGITGNDFGFRSDFEELTVWAVFNATKQITTVAVTPVTKDDHKHDHAPP